MSNCNILNAVKLAKLVQLPAFSVISAHVDAAHEVGCECGLHQSFEMVTTLNKDACISLGNAQTLLSHDIRGGANAAYSCLINAILQVSTAAQLADQYVDDEHVENWNSRCAPISESVRFIIRQSQITLSLLDSVIRRQYDVDRSKLYHISGNIEMSYSCHSEAVLSWALMGMRAYTHGVAMELSKIQEMENIVRGQEIIDSLNTLTSMSDVDAVPDMLIYEYLRESNLLELASSNVAEFIFEMDSFLAEESLDSAIKNALTWGNDGAESWLAESAVYQEEQNNLI